MNRVGRGLPVPVHIIAHRLDDGDHFGVVRRLVRPTLNERRPVSEVPSAPIDLIDSQALQF